MRAQGRRETKMPLCSTGSSLALSPEVPSWGWFSVHMRVRARAGVRVEVSGRFNASAGSLWAYVNDALATAHRDEIAPIRGIPRPLEARIGCRWVARGIQGGFPDLARENIGFLLVEFLLQGRTLGGMASEEATHSLQCRFG
jgi:hypothetical protein